MDTAELTEQWNRCWPGVPPIGHMLRGHRWWVRFHSLPSSKRYAESEREYEILLDRYNTMINELSNGETALLLVTCEWAEQKKPDPDRPNVGDLTREAVLWRAVPPDEYSDCWTHVFVSSLTWRTGVLDPILRAVADDELAGVIVMPLGMQWLYHPYDGGADVFLPTQQWRDNLRTHYRDWLSTHPLGL